MIGDNLKLREALAALLRKYVAERDCVYESCINADGEYDDDLDRLAVKAMDAVIAQARAALSPNQ